jgi:hypothetical protein
MVRTPAYASASSPTLNVAMAIGANLGPSGNGRQASHLCTGYVLMWSIAHGPAGHLLDTVRKRKVERNARALGLVVRRPLRVIPSRRQMERHEPWGGTSGHVYIVQPDPPASAVKGTMRDVEAYTRRKVSP